MNALSRTLVTLVIATFGGTTFAANLHCRPDVKVVNEKPASIKVLKFKYKVNGGEPESEGLNNRKIGANGDDETWKSQRLNHAAEGIAITDIAVEFKNDNSGAGDGYGPAVSTTWLTQTGTCNNNRTYTVTVR